MTVFFSSFLNRALPITETLWNFSLLPFFPSQVSHCGAVADWATCVTLGVTKPSQWAESFPLVKRPRFLHALVVHLFHHALFLIRSRLLYMSIVGVSDLALPLCGSEPVEQHAPSYVWSQPCQEVMLFSSPCYFVLSGNICFWFKATGGCNVSAFLFPHKVLDHLKLGGSLRTSLSNCLQRSRSFLNSADSSRRWISVNRLHLPNMNCFSLHPLM